MSERDTGGPAFPHESIARITGNVCEGDRFTVSGMTLRDYAEINAFTAIVQAMMSRYKEHGYTDTSALHEAVKRSREYADIFIDGRNK